MPACPGHATARYGVVVGGDVTNTLPVPRETLLLLLQESWGHGHGGPWFDRHPLLALRRDVSGIWLAGLAPQPFRCITPP